MIITSDFQIPSFLNQKCMFNKRRWMDFRFPLFLNQNSECGWMVQIFISSDLAQNPHKYTTQTVLCHEFVRLGVMSNTINV